MMSQIEAKKIIYEFNYGEPYRKYFSPAKMDEAIEILGKKEAEKIERSALYKRNRVRWKKEQ